MYNKKLLLETLKNLDKAKKPTKKRDIDYNSKMGYRDDSPFRNKQSMDIYTEDGTIDMSNTGMPIMANGKVLSPYSGMHQFDTNVVTEVPLEEAKKGGSKKYSKSILATNKVFKKNPLFKKPKKSKLFKKTNYKGRTYDPAAMYFQDGGVSPLEGDLISKVIMNRNKGVDFVDRAFALGDNPGTPMFNLPDDEQFGQNMSHKMAWGEDDNGQAWMYPTIMNPNNEAIQVPNQYADYISSEGYKNATGMNQHKAGGALLTKKVTCKKCGWKWDAADGGNDVTTCHKCGGQGLVHAQNGGVSNYINTELTQNEIDQYVKGGYVVEDISIPRLTQWQSGGEYTIGDEVDEATKLELEKLGYTFEIIQ
jgi:hypothetical protein